MTNGPIDKIEGARQQLDLAIRLLDGEDVSAHTLASAAYCVLRDLLGLDLRKLENALRLGEVPGFLKHARIDPNDILREHSDKTVHLTIALAIQLWQDNGKELTDAMRKFNKRSNPYKPGYRHSATLEAVQQGRLPDVSDILTRGSTVSGAGTFMREPRRTQPHKRDK